MSGVDYPSTTGVLARLSEDVETLKRIAGGGSRVLGFGWFGPYALNIIQGATFVVPEVEGASITFDLTRIVFRLSTPASSGDTTMHVEKSAGGGAFSGSSIGGLTLAAGSYEDESTVGFGTVTSGDLLRLVWDNVGTGARDYTVEVEGTEA